MESWFSTTRSTPSLMIYLPNCSVDPPPRLNSSPGSTPACDTPTGPWRYQISHSAMPKNLLATLCSEGYLLWSPSPSTWKIPSASVYPSTTKSSQLAHRPTMAGWVLLLQVVVIGHLLGANVSRCLVWCNPSDQALTQHLSTIDHRSPYPRWWGAHLRVE